MKMKTADFVPPIFSRFFKKFFSSRREISLPQFFLTYEEAREACSGAGYEEVHLVETVFEKTRLVKDQMLKGKFPLSDATTQSLLAVLRVCEKKKQLKVIDFGGACGAHYFQLRPFLPLDVQLEWVVVETSTMVSKAKAFETDELQFCNSLSEASEKLQTVDFVHSSGALQYVPDPQRTVLEFISCNPAYIFLNRLALSYEETLITIQESLLSTNGPGPLLNHVDDRLCRYLVTYFPKRKLDEMLTQNYRLVFSFAETNTRVGEKEIIGNAGMLFERYQ